MYRPLLLCALLCAASASAQVFQVSPSGPLLEGEEVSIRVTGLAPGTALTLDAERVVVDSGRPATYRARASFVAGADGAVDLAHSAPVSGSYRGADARGLFWSMTPVPNEAGAGLAPQQVRLVARVDGKQLADTRLQFVAALPSVQVEPVPQFPGAVFARLPGPQKRPVLIVLGGSEGGSLAARETAPRLASRGFAVLGLPYYSPAAWGASARELPDLPQSFVDIPVDRLQQVYAWLRTRSDIDSTRIGILGVSKGAEFALIAASRMPWIGSVAAIVPSDVVWQGWGPDVAPGATRSSFSYGGKALAFVPNKDFPQELAGFQTGAEVRMRRPQDKGRAANPAAAIAARIPVEDFKGPMLVAGGIEDQMWASGMMAQNIAERRAAAGLQTIALVYTDAGHLLFGSGWNPTTQYNAGPSKTGGTPEANARAQAEVWRETLAFFRLTLAAPSERSK